MVSIALQIAYAGFVTLAICSAVAWARQRDPARRDVALALVTLAIPALSVWVRSYDPPGRLWWELVSIMLFLLHPVALVHLSTHVWPALRRLIPGFLGLYLVMLVVVFLSGSLTPVTAPSTPADGWLVLYFVSVCLFAAAALAQAGDRHVGLSRFRSWSVSAAALATALGIAGEYLRTYLGITGIEELSDLISLFVLLTYAMAIFPPAPLRRAVEAAEAAHFMTRFDRALFGSTSSPRAGRPADLAQLAARMVGRTLHAGAVEVRHAPPTRGGRDGATYAEPPRPFRVFRGRVGDREARRRSARRPRPAATTSAAAAAETPPASRLLARWQERRTPIPTRLVRHVAPIGGYGPPLGDLVVECPNKGFFVGDLDGLLDRIGFVIAVRMDAAFRAAEQNHFLESERRLTRRLDVERRRLRDTQRELQVIIDTAEEALLRIDLARGRVAPMNVAAKRLLEPLRRPDDDPSAEVSLLCLTSLVPDGHPHDPLVRALKVHSSDPSGLERPASNIRRGGPPRRRDGHTRTAVQASGAIGGAAAARARPARVGRDARPPRWRPEYEHLLRRRLQALAEYARPTLLLVHGQPERYLVRAHAIDERAARWVLVVRRAEHAVSAPERPPGRPTRAGAATDPRTS